VNYYLAALGKYADFSGRARRAEYWMFTLFSFIATIVAVILDAAAGTGGVFYLLYAAAVFLPGLAVSCRRLHDTNRSGWWMLVPIISLIFYCQDSDYGPNRFGPNPKVEEAPDYVPSTTKFESAQVPLSRAASPCLRPSPRSQVGRAT
jgi:uncharacterized membrane protein YhaH (DUF805 family)